MSPCYTTVEKTVCPRSIVIKELLNDGQSAKCECYDGDGIFIHTYSMSEIRPYPAEEYWEDIANFHNLKKCNHSSLEELLDYVVDLASEYDEFRDEIEEELDEDGMDVMDLDSKTLWEYDRAGEIGGLLYDLQEIIQEEIVQAKTAEEKSAEEEPDR